MSGVNFNNTTHKPLPQSGSTLLVLDVDSFSDGQILKRSGTTLIGVSSGSFEGDVDGPVTSTDRAIATWNGTTGDLLRDNSTVLVDANGFLSASSGLYVSGGALTVVNQAITQTTGGQVTFAGNVNADGGVDVAGAALTITNQSITQTGTSQITFGGNVNADGGLDITNAALTIANQAITQTTGGQVTFAGNLDAQNGIDITGANLTVASGLKTGVGTTSPDGDLDVESAGATTAIEINNTAADGDPILAFQLGGSSTFVMGVDDGDGDAFKIGTTAIGTGTRFSIDSSGTSHLRAGMQINRTAMNLSSSVTQSAAIGDNLIGVTAVTAGSQIDLFDASDVGAGYLLSIKDESGNAGTNNVIIDASGSQTIDGAATVTITVGYGSLEIYSDGANWFSY
jgi:predicted hotdog family 3-hydroxylacyl-ACP dehydratase